MSIRRPARGLMAVVFATLAAPTALAQDEPAAHLTLLRQTPWATPQEPVIRVEVRATNDGQTPLGDLSLGITLWSAVHSRSAYGDSLEADPVPASPLSARPVDVEGTIEPGETLSLPLELDLADAGVDPSSSLIYPLKLELRSGISPVAILRTPVIFLARRPKTPLLMAWSVVLAHPIEFGPDGTFRGTSLESALAEGGSIASAIEALQGLVDRETPVDLIVSPLLLLQLERMQKGYAVTDGGETRTVAAGEGGAAAAERALATLRQVTASPLVGLSALPFAVTPLPSLSQSGLARDIAVQLDRGREAVERLLPAGPDPAILRPPGSSLDGPSLERVAQRGVELLLMDARAVPPPEQPLGFAPPATATVGVGQRSVGVVVTDEGVQDRLDSPILEEDPLLGAQATLGELAAIWLELPSEERGVAVRVPETLPGAVYLPLSNRLSQAAFLRPEHATDLVKAFPPPDRGARLVTVGAPPFDPDYVKRLHQARRKISDYRSMLVKPSPLPDQMETTLLFAEAGQFLEDPGEGRRLIASVHRTIAAEWDEVGIEAADRVTLTSSSGQIPLRITNETGYPVRVAVELVSPRLTVQELTTELELDEESRTLVFHVDLRTTGQFPVQVLVRAPSGRTIAEATIVVRSTAYNRIALFLTIGAFVGLLLLWGRRLLRRRAS